MFDFLPATRDDLKRRGWDTLDVILVTGDAYVDHPSYGTAIIGRVLENAGYRVGVIAQPDWKSVDDFARLGRPRLFFGITAGNLDSMVANRTATKKPRRKDEYSPGGKTGLRPDRATIVYANRIREAFGDAVVAIGGIEASLRRLAHYDWWDDTVRRSILLDARADILVYGMGERQILEIASRLDRGDDLTGIRGTVIVRKDSTLTGDHREIPSYEDVKEDKDLFNTAFLDIYRNQDPVRGRTIIQKHGNRFVIQFPPPIPMNSRELDGIFELPFAKNPHPVYDGQGRVPGFETVKFSLISHRGCCGECSFCSLSMHQGRVIQSRSRQSILKEARALTERPDFKGTITDVGGPTVNLYGAKCRWWPTRGTCPTRHCLTPEKCRDLHLGYADSMKLYQEVLRLPKVKHVFLESGFRHDLLTEAYAANYLDHVCTHHISGLMKVAPEHNVGHVLELMNKPDFAVYETFVRKFRETNRRIGKEQYLVNYFISGHPGCTLEDTLALSLYLMKKKIHPEQIQDFIPLPMTLSGCMYYTEKNPFTGETLHVPKTFRERKMHRALIQYRNPGNRRYVKEALRMLGKEELLMYAYRGH
ncbi:MAG: hypothetical protein A4E62_01134 [Syntrophorhabdus sp. PtaU1.Bin002]|nr:MAG: hypothetical protein A4E62_01134 [Syntrophorhabdus sp. PtaU1.Bin002]